ncbi:MAG: SDR family NAD(P)-dependent oxidoreductase [bacterium]|nr:SDR family NAD(P)-dependent oxidoreductase [bacterium]
MAGEFEGRLALVTGGAGEIGRAAARKFLAAGARVTLADLDEAELEAARVEFQAAGERLETRTLDVADSGAVAEVIEGAHARHGRLDILVNCAGIYRHRAVLEMSDAEWDQTLEVNLRGTFAACRAAGGFMVKQERGGVIVNLASLAAQRGSPLHAHYCASKAGVIGFGRALAMELAPKVRVNAVAPGIIETKMTADMIPVRGEEWKRQIPAGRFGTADEVADAVCFLASDKAAYINGAVLNVNGGMWMD